MFGLKMDSLHVFIQIALFCKLFVTLSTYIFFDLKMDSLHVFIQSALSCKLFVTLCTYIFFALEMDRLHVIVQNMLVCKWFVTLLIYIVFSLISFVSISKIEKQNAVSTQPGTKNCIGFYVINQIISKLDDSELS